MAYAPWIPTPHTNPYSFNNISPTPAQYNQQDEHLNEYSGQISYPDPSYPDFTTYSDPTGFGNMQPQQQHPSPPISQRHSSLGNINQAENGTTASINGGNGNGGYDNEGGRSSSEEKDVLQPSQIRRKEQNRAAQRAFRERKERHVKDLESKLSKMESQSTTLLTDNERLKRELQRLAMQNELLRQAPTSVAPPRTPSPIAGPQTYSPYDFQTAVGVDPKLHAVSNSVFSNEETGERLLAAGATWDLIQSSEQYRRGMVDVADVCRRLKGNAICDGRGPVFREEEIRRAIEESVSVAGDELI